MSVLIEALSLVVPRIALDVSYPGGTDEFVAAMSDPGVETRFVCSDENLVSVSFMDPSAVKPVADRLVELGLVEIDDNSFREFAFVDQHFGPTMPCDWLSWKQDAAGYTSAWIATAEPGELAAPDGWTPEQSRRLTRLDLRDEPGRAVKLAEENGLETWLDFKTGQLSIGLPHRATDGSGDLSSQGLLTATQEALGRNKWEYSVVDGSGALTFQLSGEHTVFNFLVYLDEAQKIVVSYLRVLFRVPAGKRKEVCELLTRINYGLRIGNFEMDLSDGEIRFKSSMDVEGGVFAPKMVESLVAGSCTTFDMYYPAIMRVVYGGAKPAAAVREVEAK